MHTSWYIPHSWDLKEDLLILCFIFCSQTRERYIYMGLNKLRINRYYHSNQIHWTRNISLSIRAYISLSMFYFHDSVILGYKLIRPASFFQRVSKDSGMNSIARMKKLWPHKNHFGPPITTVGLPKM